MRVPTPLEFAKQRAHQRFLADRNPNRSAVSDEAPAVEGFVTIEIQREGQDWEVVHQDNNLVVTQAENLMANMAAGVTNAEIAEIWLGDASSPSAPSLGQTELDSFVAGENYAVTASVASGTVQFTASLTTADGNGNTFTEAALYTGTNMMFARKSGFSIAKTNSFALRFTWTLRFSVQSGNGSECSGASLYGPGVAVEDYVYTASGGEADTPVPIDFAVGAKHLDVFINGQRQVYGTHYIESATTGGGSNQKGVDWQSFTLNASDVVYVVHRRTV